MSSRVKNSTPAFQAADSGIEWVLYKVGSVTNPDIKTLADVFGVGNMAATGRYDCSALLGETDCCEFYFVDDAGAVIVVDATPLIDIDSVRSVGKYGEDEERASRAIEVMMEIAHCPDGFIPISDFCIQEDEEGSTTFIAAAELCADNQGAHLCSAAAWITACKLSQAGQPLDGKISDMTGDYEWVDDILNSGQEGLIVGNGGCTDTDEADANLSAHKYRCCVNLQQ